MAQAYEQQGNPLGWFEALYASAGGDPAAIPWADLVANPHLVEWLERTGLSGDGRPALVVGCGLGDDAEALAARGFRVTAFDISPTAIAWCQRRFPSSSVAYQTADLLDPPADWAGAFDFVLESYTLQAMPVPLRRPAMGSIARFLRPGGTLLVICRGREPGENPDAMPLPLTRDELETFRALGLTEVAFEDYPSRGDPPVRHFRAVYRA